MIKHEYRTMICETRQFKVAGSVAPCARRGSGLLRWVNCSYHHSPAIGYKVRPTELPQHGFLQSSILMCLRFAKTSLAEIRTKDKSSATKEIIRRNILHPIIDVQLDDAPLQYYSRQ
jgi:hypothetical protein